MHESTVVRLRRLSNAQLPFATTANPAVRTNRRAQAVEKKRFAVVRTFSPNDSEKLVPSFDSWDVFPPCSSGFYSYYTIDLFLSYSQLLSSNAEAQSAVDEVIKKFTTTEGWGKCLNEVHVIEANIEPEFDLYEPASVQKNPLWVNGPNRQFIHSYRSIQQRNPKYEAMIALEPDSHPRIEDWLEGLLEEVEANAPLAILGSKYDGHSWDSFLDAVPLALLHHINGNAVYNISHPYLNLIVNELEEEQNTIFNSIPYDYRISQMVVEGSLGILPEFPHKYIRDDNGDPIILEQKLKFRQWWEAFKADNPMKESSIITNFAATNFLPSHINGAAIVHGEGLYEPHDPNMKITLVVSDWNKDYANHLVSLIDQTNHPFSEVIIMRLPHSGVFGFSSFTKLWDNIQLKAKIPVNVQYRVSPDYMDICDVEVNTEWFMITNAYHQVNYDVDLMFTAVSNKPVIPYTPARADFCTDFTACRETVDVAKDFFPNADKVVLDFDMVFKTDLLKDFCSLWKEKFGEVGQTLSYEHAISPETSKGPTATSFVAYLYQKNIADQTYLFSDRTLRGAKDRFIKVFHEEEYAKYQDALAEVMHHTSRKMQEVSVPSATPVQLGLGKDCSENEQCQSNFCEDGRCEKASTPKLAFGKGMSEGETGLETYQIVSKERGGEITSSTKYSSTKSGAVLLVCSIIGVFSLLVGAVIVRTRRDDATCIEYASAGEDATIDAFVEKDGSTMVNASVEEGRSSEVESLVEEGSPAEVLPLVGEDVSAEVDTLVRDDVSAEVDALVGEDTSTEDSAFTDVDVSVDPDDFVDIDISSKLSSIPEVDTNAEIGFSSGQAAISELDTYAVGEGTSVMTDVSANDGASASTDASANFGASTSTDTSANDGVSMRTDVSANDGASVRTDASANDSDSESTLPKIV
eukprot:CAMPEP_0195515324 /NCGR_PEP_ID=MMETSP0794_2-20130614/6429_1 /TAXON_ID=515487 /ORGANISM="Stephanopyxis turris, Strain CCMP 815" /LENGTH=918 /DNA_ID=CAMNT_0040643727 /DNA_START=275 /DNA_END=3031 /DNA_ORIENTATION=-